MLVADVFGGEFPAVVSVGQHDTIADVVYVLNEHSIGAVVVTLDGKEILGIMSERDIVRHLALEHEGTFRVPVEDLMTTPVRTCGLDDDVDAPMTIMTDGHFRHMPVVDSHGDLCGIVSLGDLVHARLEELERRRGS